MNKKIDPLVADYILNNYLGVTTKELAAMIKRDLGIDVEPKRIQYFKKNRRLTSGVNTKFKKGNVPWVAGKSGMCNIGGNKTSFKKGVRPHNDKPLGSEKIIKGGYIYVKVDDRLHLKACERWKSKHQLIWEKHYKRKVPKGHFVIFADGNKRNFDINNLVLVSNKEMMYLNRHHLIYNDCELTKSGVLVARVAVKASEMKNK